MTRFLLIRHANKATPPDLLPGRSEGIELSATGKAQAVRVAGALRGQRIDRIVASPLLRAQQTAQAIAETLTLPLETDGCFNEVEIGDWTNRTTSQLEGDPQWHTYNHRRSLAVAPRGESMIGVQARFVDRLLELARLHPDETIAVVSHADPIRSALLYFLNRSLDDWMSVEIREASVSSVELDTNSVRVVEMNMDAERLHATNERNLAAER